MAPGAPAHLSRRPTLAHALPSRPAAKIVVGPPPAPANVAGMHMRTHAFQHMLECHAMAKKIVAQLGRVGGGPLQAGDRNPSASDSAPGTAGGPGPGDSESDSDSELAA